MVFSKEGVAQGAQGFRTIEVVGHARRGGEIRDPSLAVGVGEGCGGVATDVCQELGEMHAVSDVAGEVAILARIEVNGPSAPWTASTGMTRLPISRARSCSARQISEM